MMKRGDIFEAFDYYDEDIRVFTIHGPGHDLVRDRRAIPRQKDAVIDGPFQGHRFDAAVTSVKRLRRSIR